MTTNKDIIRDDNLDIFCYTNDDVLTRPVRGICIDFFGLNFLSYVPEADERSRALGAAGIVHIHPYTNPWSWMNRQAFEICERLIDVVCERYSLPADVPVVTAGCSMGGLESYNFAARTKRRVVSCMSDCAVTDLARHIEKFPYIYRSLYTAYYEEDDFGEALRDHSAVTFADLLPDCSFRIFHCSRDPQVIYEDNALPMYKALKEAGKDVILRTVDAEIHGVHDEKACVEYIQYILDAFK